MINEKLNRIEKEIQDIKEMTNTEYFKKIEEQCKRVNNAYDYMYKLNKEYKNRIKKAIEYIEENCYDEERKMVINELYNEIPELLDILKGDNK